MTLTSTPRQEVDPVPLRSAAEPARPDDAPRREPAPRRRASAPRRVRSERSVSTVRAVTWAITAVSGGALFFVAFLLVLSPLQQSRDQSVLYTQFRSELAAATAPFGVGPIPPGDPIALLRIPAIGLSQVVVEGTSGRDLRNGPGHYRVTTLPGQLGTSVIFGRSTTYGAPFRDVPTLQAGDPIQVTTGQGVFSYRVEGVRRAGDPQPAPLTADQARLLLVTTESGALGAFSTVYVDAMLVSQAAVTPPRTAVLVSTAEGEMASDPSAFLPLALWLMVLIGAGVFAAWGVTRWGKAQTWVVALPLFIVALWGASDNAALLLPNLM